MFSSSEIATDTADSETGSSAAAAAMEPFSARTLVHSVAGCAFYGAFAAKVLFVHTRGLPRWALPATGALLITAVVVAWLTSTLWLFSVAGLHL